MTFLRLMAVALTTLLSCCALRSQQPAANQTGSPPEITTPVWPQAYPNETTAGLGAQVSALLSDPGVSRAHWGIAVTAMDGTPVFGLDEAKLFRPASTAKLFTTAAAISILGPDHRFTTKIYGNLDKTTGQVAGSLDMVGAGDPSFGTTDLPYRTSTSASAKPAAPASIPNINELADALAAQGVRAVNGNVTGDDSAFLTEPAPEGWNADDLTWGYGTLPTALSVSDNELKVMVSPKPLNKDPGETSVSVQISQAAPYFSVRNDAFTRSPDHPAPKSPSMVHPSDSIGIEETSGSHPDLHVFGSMAPNAAPVIEHVSIPDPARYTAEVLRAALIERGIPVTGKADVIRFDRYQAPSFLRELRAPLDACEDSLLGTPATTCIDECLRPAHRGAVLAQHTSSPLVDDIVFTLKTSANLHAEMLLHDIAPGSCPGVSNLEGSRILRGWVLRAGIQPDDFILYDGSGLSTKDLVTPRAEAQLLAYAAQQPWFAQWKPALPIGGVDGTLASRFKDTPLKGHIFAKTGTLGESRALAGYVDCASGKQLIFSIMVDNHEPGTSADREVMDKIVAAIAATN